MSETKFTPGPWVAHPYGSHKTEIREDKASGARIASAFMSSAPGAVERNVANAHLIAAAPDLYAENENAALALEEAAKLLRSKGLNGCGDIMDRQAASCRAASAKARAEQVPA